MHVAAAQGLPTLADPGHQGAGIGIHVPFRQPADGRRLGVDNRTDNKLLRAMRAVGERAPGVDAVSIADFDKDLKDNLYKIWNRMFKI